jgi:hypothetical protein
MAKKKTRLRGITSPGGTVAPRKTKPRKPKAAPAAAAAAAAPAAPAAPTPVAGFNTGTDLAAINDFLTNYTTSLEDIDNQLNTLGYDTKFQKTENDKDAKEATSGSADAMAARGMFQSSVKDAALYDIEAQRALSNKFLDDKLTQATLNAGTRKQTLAQSKKRFDEANILRMGENAAGVNDAANSAWADQMATHAQLPKPKAPAAPAKAYKEKHGKDSQGNPGVWHIYPDGRKVFVRR